MDHLKQRFSVQFGYDVFFTHNLFHQDNPVFRDFLQFVSAGTAQKIFFVIDKGVSDCHPRLIEDIRYYFASGIPIRLVEHVLVVPGGEPSKNTAAYLDQIIDAVNMYGIDRHSYIAAVGGGAVLDLAGYASAISHRGIRHIRIPTTVLSQNDSGVGVKNGINYKGKKNFIGTFAPPVAVFSDFSFLATLSDGDWRSGMSEAVKVALIKDKLFFDWLVQNSSALAARDTAAMEYLIKRCAQLHMEHIAGGDPFEMGSSRPLDFGHWSAHKVEQLSHFTIRHGEAVAMGIALDTAYSFVSGRIGESDARLIVDLLKKLGLAVTHPLMMVDDESSAVLKGLHEFREHLGGRLTIMLLTAIGRGEEVHELDIALLKGAAAWLKTIA